MENCPRGNARCPSATDKFSYLLPHAVIWLQDMCPSVLMGYTCPTDLTLTVKHLSSQNVLFVLEDFVSLFPLLCLEVSKSTAEYLGFFSQKSAGLCY